MPNKSSLTGKILEARILHKKIKEEEMVKEAALLSQYTSKLPNNCIKPNNIVWLEPVTDAMSNISNMDKEAHRSALRLKVKNNIKVPFYRNSVNACDDNTSSEGRNLCIQCRGSCCRPGADSNAFIDVDLLNNWQDHHPGTTIEDAISAYVNMLPSQHVKGSCLYHSSQGCTIDRQFRSPICNSYACNSLRKLINLSKENTELSVLAVTSSRDTIEKVAVVDKSGIHRIEVI